MLGCYCRETKQCKSVQVEDHKCSTIMPRLLQFIDTQSVIFILQFKYTKVVKIMASKLINMFAIKGTLCDNMTVTTVIGFASQTKTILETRFLQRKN
jgi:hypothetical protein